LTKIVRVWSRIMSSQRTPGSTSPLGPRNLLEGPHTAEALSVLGRELIPAALESVKSRALTILRQCVNPTAGPPPSPSDGLLYGLIQSGKTSIITVVSALAADNGFDCIITLTSDINLLYDQTLERLKKALRGLRVLGKDDWADAVRFGRQLRSTPFAIACSKNVSKLQSLLDAFRTTHARRLSMLLIDDEADQASLNTRESSGTGDVSRINQVISDFRSYFTTNTYLQVTATPQALFLQRPNHRYRPSFTVLSEPGEGYVGGEVFFSEDSNLLRYVDIEEVNQFQRTNQPSPTPEIPVGMRRAILAFLVGATSEMILEQRDEGFAFLCHVSMRRLAHNLIVQMIDRLKEQTIAVLSDSSSPAYGRFLDELRAAYDDLMTTATQLADFENIVSRLKFYLPGANIKLINATSNEEIKLDSVYNIFVGGNKLGRGVTIRNLLVSYYGRNPNRPNADTVLQHARMYGYRRGTLDITRLFLPELLADRFRIIHQMENALRDLVNRHPEGKFEGIFISPPIQPTRSNVLDPNSIGLYVAGRSYNPRYPLRTQDAVAATQYFDSALAVYLDDRPFYEVSVDILIELLDEVKIDPRYGYDVWQRNTIKAALESVRNLHGNRGYLVVRRGRSLNEPRRETQGILSGGEDALAPRDAVTVFMYRQNENTRGETAAWWPQLRFADGNYVLAFSFER